MAFDQNGKLWQWTQQQNFDQIFTEQVVAELGEVRGKVIHFTQKECNCNAVAKEHIESVERLAVTQGFENKVVTLSKVSELSTFLPSTPAIAAFDEQGKLFYLGPYAAGYACAVGNGIVESFLLKKATNPIGATIISDTKGCYCSI